VNDLQWLASSRVNTQGMAKTMSGSRLTGNSNLIVAALL
jgi:hypothetical protein